MNLPVNTLANIDDPIAQARYNMIEQQIRPWDVHAPSVLELLAIVRREDFVPAAYRSLAFADMEIPIGHGQRMLAPPVEARLLQELQVQPTDRALEIGAGSGYMAALLSHLAASVVTLEIEPALAKMAADHLLRAGVTNVEVRVADGSQGPIAGGPFDVIVLSGSVAAVPQSVLDLLADGGRLVAIVGEEPVMRAHVVRRTGNQFTAVEPWDTIAPRLAHFPEPRRFHF